MNNTPETVFDLTDLLTRVNDAFVQAAIKLDETFKAKDKDGQEKWQAPYVYHMPKMTLRVQLSLSYSKSEVKGVFGKVSNGSDQSMVSEITLDLVAVPRNK